MCLPNIQHSAPQPISPVPIAPTFRLPPLNSSLGTSKLLSFFPPKTGHCLRPHPYIFEYLPLIISSSSFQERDLFPLPDCLRHLALSGIPEIGPRTRFPPPRFSSNISRFESPSHFLLFDFFGILVRISDPAICCSIPPPLVTSYSVFNAWKPCSTIFPPPASPHGCILQHLRRFTTGGFQSFSLYTL